MPKRTDNPLDLDAIRARNEERRERLRPHNETGIYVSFDQYWNGAVVDVETLLAEVHNLEIAVRHYEKRCDCNLKQATVFPLHCCEFMAMEMMRSAER